MKNQICFLCGKKIKNYKYNDKKITVCEYCTIELCKHLPRRNGEPLEIIKLAMEVSKTLDMATT